MRDLGLEGAVDHAGRRHRARRFWHHLGVAMEMEALLRVLWGGWKATVLAESDQRRRLYAALERRRAGVYQQADVVLAAHPERRFSPCHWEHGRWTSPLARDAS